MQTPRRPLLALALIAASASVAGAQWRIDPKPLFHIDGTAGDEYLFTRIEAVARLSDGRLVVADQRMTDVRVFDAAGKFVKHIGRKGRGPGEYSFPYWVGATRGDTIYVFDYSEGPGTLISYSPDGAFIKSATVLAGVEAQAALPFRLLRDGSLLFKGSVPSSYPRGKQTPYRGESGVIRYSFADSVKHVMRIPGQIIENFEKRPPWYIDGRVAATDSLLFVGDGDTPAISIYGLDGKLRRTGTMTITRRAVTAGDKDAWRKDMDELAARDAQMRVSIQRQIDRTVFPSEFPLYQAWLTDRAGNLWVGLHPGLVRNAPIEYLVFDESLKQIARATLPAGFVPKDIGRDYVIGVMLDSDDVPHVWMHRLIK